MANEAIEQLKQCKQKIDLALEEFFDRKIQEAEEVDKSAVEIMKNLKEFNLRGGKRIRPALMISAYKCFAECDEQTEKDVIFASLAVELMEGFLLIHDDVLDQDDLRRGGPTLHKVYEKEYKDIRSITPKRFGENVAIVAGDMQNSLANEIIALSNFSAEKKTEFLRKYHSTALKTEYGWLLESILTTKHPSEVTEEDVMKVNGFKTAAYTIEGPLHIGALLGGAGKDDITLLTGFAILLGQAFQIQDDILGMFGDEKKLGKPIGSDIIEGKITLLITKAMENCSEEDKKILLENLGKKDLSIEDIEKVRKVVTDSGSLDYSKKLAEELIKQSKSVIDKADLRPEGRDFIVGIADFLIKREY
ncbi:polyprenyl synthetase family protein [Thermoproteota archaeon]